MNPREKRIEIAFVADAGYVMPTCVAIASVLENRRKDYTYHIYVFMPAGTPASAVRLMEQAGEGRRM